MSADEGRTLLPGIVAVALFALLALVSVGTSFTEPAGFVPSGMNASNVSVTASIGYSMLGIEGGSVPAENFLAVFEIIDLVLVAALVGSVLLARREGSLTGPLEGGEE